MSNEENKIINPCSNYTGTKVKEAAEDVKKAKATNNPIFCNKGISNTTLTKLKQYSKAELNRINVFKHIEKTEPTTIWRVHKEMRMAYNTVSYIVRDLIFAGVVSDRPVIGDNNVCHKELSIPRSNSKTGEEQK